MESRTLSLLEFPKVLEALAGYAVSEPGAAACLAIRPMDDLSAIRLEGSLTEQASRWAADTGFALRGFPPLDGLFAFVAERGEPLDLDGFFALAQVLLQAKEVRDSLTNSKDESLDDLRSVLCSMPWPAKLASALSRCVNPDGNIKDDASPELAVVRADIRSIHRQCTKKAKDFILSHDLSRFLQDDYITLASDRYVLPLKANFKTRLAGIVHDYSQTGETCYFEPMLLVEQNNRLQELKKEEAREEMKILKYLTSLLVEERDMVRAAYAFLVRLDLLLAKASLAGAIHGRSLEVQEGGRISLLRARHPLLMLAARGRETVHPIDVEMRPGDNCLLISGGNAGGKTVALKTVGLTALMAYSGLPVAVEGGSTFPLLSSIFVIMGDEQSLEENVSTFTAQVRNVSRIWDSVNERTLCLLDEFGAGTDPSQGAALAQAVLERIMERGALVFAATHFPALKAWALSRDHVRAASVLFDPTTKKPLYELAYEIVGASIALDVARESGLPPEILETAEKLLLLDGTDTSVVLGKLNELAVQRKGEISSLAAEKKKFAAKRAKLQERFDQQRDKLLKEVRAQSQAIMREWKEGRAGRKEAQKKLGNLREKLTIEDVTGAPSEAAKPFSFTDIAVGDTVSYVLWNKQGGVLEKDERKEQVRLDLDGVTMWVKGKDLGPAGTEAARPAKPKASAANVQAAAPAKNAALALILDIRGRRADEAVGELERFLDDAILRGAGSLEIVHGRGTGALRREVHEVLKHFPGVESFALANEDRGGDGMTEVTLR